MNLNNRSLWIAGAIAGALMAILSTIPIINLANCLLCAWLWLGGMFAVWFYRRDNRVPLSMGQGATIGAVAGLIGAVIATILGLILGGAGLASSLASQAETLGETGDMIVGLMAGGLGTVIGLFFNLVFYTAFGAIGGLIGASLFAKPTNITPPM